MVRLCNDYNLIIPDKVLVYLFFKFEEKFGDNYQNNITKTKYQDEIEARELVNEIIQHFKKQILIEMDTNKFVKFKYSIVDTSNRLVLEELKF